MHIIASDFIYSLNHHLSDHWLNEGSAMLCLFKSLHSDPLTSMEMAVAKSVPPPTPLLWDASEGGIKTSSISGPQPWRTSVHCTVHWKPDTRHRVLPLCTTQKHIRDLFLCFRLDVCVSVCGEVCVSVSVCVGGGGGARSEVCVYML